MTRFWLIANARSGSVSDTTREGVVAALESRGAPVKPGEMLEAVRRAGEDVKALRARVLTGGR